MALTYEPIATTAISSTVTSVTFSSISASYTDLILIVAPTGGSVADINMQFNSDTAGNYSSTYLTGSGTTASSGRYTNDTAIRTNYYGGTNAANGMQIIQIQNYSNTTTNKTALVRANNASYGTDAIVGLWRSTSAINAIKLNVVSGGNWTSGNITLYGIKAA